MLSLVVARPGAIADGLVALLRSVPDIRQIAQVVEPTDALDFIQALKPDLILIHAVPLCQEMTDFVGQVAGSYEIPQLIVVGSKSDAQRLRVRNTDIVVIEGVSSAQIRTHILSITQGGH